MQKLIVSKYLKIVPRETDYAVYHSLFGNLTLIDPEGKKILEAFKTASSIEAVAVPFDRNKSLILRSYINNLRAKSFLIEDGTNEYDLIESDSRRRKKKLQSGYLVRALQLVVTNSCNFGCKYCFVDNMYNSKKRADLQCRPTNMKMTFDVASLSVANLLDLLERNGNRYLSLEFFGGEPLMNWPVIESVLETFKNGDPNRVEITYSITTNGYLITERMAELFKKYGVTVTVSFDAPSKSKRAILNNEKGGERVKQNLEMLKNNGNWVTFNSVLSKETIDEHDGKALVDIAKYYNIRMIGLILDLCLDFYDNKANIQKIVDELWSTYQYGQSQGIPIVGYWHQIFNQVAGKQPINLLSGYKTCPAIGCKLSVEPEGHVFICKCCSQYIGHINNLDHVLSSPQYETYAMQVYRNATECDGCEIEGFCSGVCMGSLEKKYQRIDVTEKSSCYVFKGITEKLIKNIPAKEVDINYFSTLARKFA